MILVSHQQLQGVLPGAERQLCLGLAGTKVQVVEIVGYGLIQRRQIGIDQKVMVPRIRTIRTRRCNTHVSQAEMDGQLGRNSCPIFEVIKICLRASRRWRRASSQRDTDVNAS